MQPMAPGCGCSAWCGVIRPWLRCAIQTTRRRRTSSSIAIPPAIKAQAWGSGIGEAATGGSLIRFDSATPGAVTTLGAISGAIARLDGLDFRPADGLLYGYEANGSGIYRVNINTGATTLVSTSSVPVGNGRLGIDFNPVVDRLRVVNSADDNRRINVATGAATADGALVYAVGDVNAGSNPQILDAAYLNADVNVATGTQLYYIDTGLDALITTSAPNAGTLTTVGALGVNANGFLGFDIATDALGFNIAYASLRVGVVDGLYTIDLGNGSATFVGDIAASQLFGLAAAPATPAAQAVAIPEPGSLALVAAAGLAVWGLRRRGARVSGDVCA